MRWSRRAHPFGGALLLLVVLGWPDRPAASQPPPRTSAGGDRAPSSAASAAAHSTARASARDAPAQARPLLVRLTPSDRELHGARVAALEQKLARTLAAVPEVERATVQLSLPLLAEAPLDRPLPSPAAAVVLQVRDRAPSGEEVWSVLRSAVPALPREQLAMVVRRAPLPRPAPSTLVTVGPFRVAAASAPALRLVLALSLICNALLAAVLLARSQRAVIARTVARYAGKRFF